MKKIICSIVALTLFLGPDIASALDTHRSIPDFPINEYTLETSSGLPVRYYISKGKPNRPLIIFIQGSGCKPVTNGANLEGGSSVYDFIPTALKRNFNAMVIDKPFTNQKSDIQKRQTNSCSEKFNQNFSFESWLNVLNSAYTHAMKNTDVAKANTLIIGFSEGAVMASALASKHKNISKLALIGANGDNQVFDFISLAHTQGKVTEIESITKTVKEIVASPENFDKFAWGHTYKRWASFFKASPSEFLKNTEKRVYLASGTKDQSVPIQSSELLYSRLLLQGSDVTFRRVVGAGHNLLMQGDSWEKLDTEYQLIKDWAFR